MTYPNPWEPHRGAFNRELIRGLRSGHDVRVISPVAWTQRWRRPPRQCPEADTWYPLFVYPNGILRNSYAWWLHLSIRKTLREELKHFQPDVILSYWAHPDGATAVSLGKRWSVPVIVMIGGSDVKLQARETSRKRVISKVLQNADRVIAFSKDLGTNIEQLGVEPTKIDIVYRGVDQSVFHPGDKQLSRQLCKVPPDAVLLVWAGRMVEVKDPLWLIKSLRTWKEHFGKRLMTIMIGDGPLRSEVESFMRSEDVTDVCKLLGGVPHHQIAEWFRAADATVLTSKSEGIPNVLLESISCGTPFVATDVGGIREIASEHHDLLVPRTDPVHFANVSLNHLKKLVGGPQASASTNRSFVPDDLSGLAKRIERSIAIAKGES